MVVKEYQTTSVSYKELREKYDIFGPNTIRQWVYKFNGIKPNTRQIEISEQMQKESDNDSKKTKRELELEAKVAALEKKLSHEQLRLEALNTLIDVAEEQLKIDIRKKRGTKQ
tara:strand:- start:91 stop:429 length:339 start_codon:yes stop_codon:yes gene_type:complete